MSLTKLISLFSGNGAADIVKTQVGPQRHHPLRLPGAPAQAAGGGRRHPAERLHAL